MDLQLIIRYAKKSMSVVGIDQDLAEIFGSDAMTYSTVVRDLREVQLRAQKILLPATNKMKQMI
jgi:hypothetical protein